MPGYDISEFQTNYPANADFVIIRLSHGLMLDKKAEEHIKLAKERKTPFALYHYAENGTSGTAQAMFAVLHMKGLDCFGHKLVCDAEGNVTVPVVKAFIATAERLLRPRLRRFWFRERVGIYSGNWAKEHGGFRFGAQFGWLADYIQFDRPRFWTRRFTKIWQYSDGGGKLDHDRGMGPVDIAKYFKPYDRDGRK